MYARYLGIFAAVAIWAAGLAHAQVNNGQPSRPVAPARATPEAGPVPGGVSDRLNANTVTIISGNPNGTYLYFAYDMSAVLDDGNSLRVLPIVGKGAAQNIKDLLYLKGVDMGITQSDILRHFMNTGELGANIASRLRYIARLYNEEMHILASKDINSIEELRGKKVNFSDAGSGTQISCHLIFNALGLKVEEVNMGQADAFEALKRGEIAATVLFGGKPAAAFAKLNPTSGDVRLLNVPYAPNLHQDYLPSSLTHNDYPDLIPENQVVDTIAVGSVLAVFNWAADSDRYRRVALFTEALYKNFDKFMGAPRHPKWREVNLAAKLPGWERLAAAEEMIGKTTSTAQARTTGSEIVTNATGGGSVSLNETNREELFRSFLKWRDGQQAR
jgi:TRAP transporter TAXI family solute receptor